MSTVVIGSARDIVEECAVPRFVFTDFPLGNPCGKPNDRASQETIIDSALQLLEQAFNAQTTVKAPVEWGDDNWRETYMQISKPAPLPKRDASI